MKKGDTVKTTKYKDKHMYIHITILPNFQSKLRKLFIKYDTFCRLPALQDSNMKNYKPKDFIYLMNGKKTNRELSTNIADYHSIKLKCNSWHLLPGYHLFRYIYNYILWQIQSRKPMLDKCSLIERDLTGWRWAAFVIVFQASQQPWLRICDILKEKKRKTKGAAVA